MQSIHPQKQIELAERMIVLGIQKEVEKAIKEMVMPTLEARFKDLAADVVGAWAVNIQSEKQMAVYDNITKVKVEFVTNVINQLDNPSVLKVEVKK